MIPDVYLWNASGVTLEYCFKIPALFLEGRVTTGTFSFVSAIVIAPELVELVMTQSPDPPVDIKFFFTMNQKHFRSPPKVTIIFQRHSCFNIYRITRKNGFSCYFCLEFNVSGSFTLSFGLCLWYHKRPDPFT